jgi:hypothetical protein
MNALSQETVASTYGCGMWLPGQVTAGKLLVNNNSKYIESYESTIFYLVMAVAWNVRFSCTAPSFTFVTVL